MLTEIDLKTYFLSGLAGHVLGMKFLRCLMQVLLTWHLILRIKVFFLFYLMFIPMSWAYLCKNLWRENVVLLDLSVKLVEVALEKSILTESDKTKSRRSYRIDHLSRHIDYVRYADNFFMGIVGPKEFVVEIRSKVDPFVKGALHLGIKIKKGHSEP
jgi:hypothetical protein